MTDTLDGGKAYTQMMIEEKSKDRRVLKQIRREWGLAKTSSIYPYLGR